MKTHGLYFLYPFILIILTNCGSVRPPGQPEFEPIRPDATAPAANTPAGQPTSVVSAQIDLSSFIHPSERFSISYPENWQYFERPDGVVFIDPGNHAGYGVFFNEAGQVYSEKELNQYLVTFVSKNFIDKDANFTPMSQEQKADGSIVAQFSSQDPNLGQAISEVRVSQKETIVFVLYLSATEEQWQVSQRQLQRLADTFTILDTTPAAITTPATQEPPEWVLTGPLNSAFGFFYPSDWEILRQDEASVAVGLPETDLVFEATVLEISQAKKDDPAAAAKEAAQKYADQLEKDYKGMQLRPVETFQLDQVTDGATLDFLYTAANGQPVAGSIITAASEGRLYQVVFSSSAEFYQGALQWFNPMYKSFRILPAENVIKEP